MTKKDAETLLKYGAYDFFKEEREGRSDELSNAFCEADIDQILEKNTKVITIDSQGGSSFSKASTSRTRRWRWTSTTRTSGRRWWG